MALKLDRLAGSTRRKPWVLEDDGNLALSGVRAPLKVKKKNHPSLIPQETRWERAAREIRTATVAAANKRDASTQTDPEKRGPSWGRRDFREAPLTRDDLWLDEERPPVLAVPKPHHVCGLCRDVKSHPVSYACGHSHCYACIRVWLEGKWTCPKCDDVMRRAPVRHEGEEDGIKFDYPWWKDRSVVSYSWEGLEFPY
ncbi:hypothetical protein C8R47DRAFT_1224922 [Mycena vitilis]|nr:hypothetical protein C8R47DRAFT_1224922 [Mycena vitilis]